MNVLVCIKQVPDNSVVPKLDPNTNRVVTEGVELMESPFDLNAVEAGLKLEEENGVQYVAARKEEDQVSLTAIGEGEVLDALRRCQPDTLTPIEAMSLIYEWKQKLN